MSSLVSTSLTSPDIPRFFAISAKHLPHSSHERMRRFVTLYPEAFRLLMLEGELIGICYGWFRRHFTPEDPSFTLDGICILSDYQRRGYGTQLLYAFEEVARSYGAPSVSVGSGLEAEPFYIACGYAPKEYKCWTDGKPMIEHTYTSLEDYRTYQRQNPDGFVVLEKAL